MRDVNYISWVEKGVYEQKLIEFFNTVYTLLNKDDPCVTEDHIIALDISIFFEQKELQENVINIFSYSTPSYQGYLAEFLNSGQSLMLNNSMTKKFKTQQSISGTGVNNSETKQVSSGVLTYPSSKGTSTKLNDWANFLSNKNLHGTTHWHQIVKEHFKISLFLTLSCTTSENFLNSINKLFGSRKFIEDFFSVIFERQIHAHQQLVKHALKAAISQVMARNMSHNIGSHVSYRATNIEVKKRLKELYSIEPDTDKKVIEWIDLMSEKLDKYEIARNEYLADYEQAPKTFKFYKDVILPFCENTLILDNITASENINYDNNTCINKLKIRCTINGQEINAIYPDLQPYSMADCDKQVSYPEMFPYLVCAKTGNLFDALANPKLLAKKIEDGEASVMEDVEVTLHSEQAFYSILENVIRNSAKHNKAKCEIEGLEITVDITEDIQDDNFYKVTIYDNVSEKEFSELCDENPNSLVIYQRIKRSLLNESGQIRRENWGYADIRINAFLFTHFADDLSDEGLKDILQLVSVRAYNTFEPIQDTKGKVSPQDKIRFGYQFKISKPKKILWIGSFEKAEWTEKLKKQGIVFIEDISALDENFMKGISAFQFAVINTGMDDETLLKYKSKIPGRILLIGNHNVELPYAVSATSKVLLNDVEQVEPGTKKQAVNAERLLMNCYKVWLERRIEKPINLFFHFEDTSIAEKWDPVTLDEGFFFSTTRKIDEQLQLKDSHFNILYDHHGAVTSGTETNQSKFFCQGMDFFTQNSIIEFEKGNYDQHPISNPVEDKEQNALLLYEVMDAVTTNVFILDERILKIAEGNTCSFKQPDGSKEIGEINNKNWKMLAAGKVYVISQIESSVLSDKFVFKIFRKDGRIAFETNHAKATERLNQLRKDAIILHRTYLDKEITGLDTTAFINLLNNYFGTVIITSGGGYPHNLETDVKFVPFSTIEQFVNLRLSKYRLNSIIQSITKS